MSAAPLNFVFGEKIIHFEGNVNNFRGSIFYFGGIFLSRNDELEKTQPKVIKWTIAIQ